MEGEKPVLRMRRRPHGGGQVECGEQCLPLLRSLQEAVHPLLARDLRAIPPQGVRAMVGILGSASLGVRRQASFQEGGVVMAIKLTRRQKEALCFIQDHIREHRIPPTIKQIADHMGVTVTAGRNYVVALQKKGYITRKPGSVRSIAVVGMEEPAFGYTASAVELGVLRDAAELFSANGRNGSATLIRHLEKKLRGVA